VAPLAVGQWVEAREAFLTETDARGAAVDRAILAFSETKNAAASALEVSADAQSDLEVQIAGGLSAAAVLVALLLGFVLSRDIARAAGQVARAAKGLAVGNLDRLLQFPRGRDVRNERRHTDRPNSV
jgi:hypothetical protein